MAFADGAVSTLVREWLRRGDRKTIVTPKLVDWNDARLAEPLRNSGYGEYLLSLIRQGKTWRGA